jgi:hypothetical protein
MRLHPHEFIRRFLMHVLPKDFHRIRHYGLFANANRAERTSRQPAHCSISSGLLEQLRGAGCTKIYREKVTGARRPPSTS